MIPTILAALLVLAAVILAGRAARARIPRIPRCPHCGDRVPEWDLARHQEYCDGGIPQ